MDRIFERFCLSCYEDAHFVIIVVGSTQFSRQTNSSSSTYTKLYDIYLLEMVTTLRRR